MTNREKIREIFPNVIFIYRKEEDKTNAIMCSDEWLDSEYIEPLEQEPILDKIKAEIEQDAFKDVNGSKYIFVNRVNRIFDKYKESEE